MNYEAIIAEHEEILLAALQSNDIEKLDELFHDKLLFNIPNGQTITKAMDLENYSSGKMVIHEILPSEQQISFIDDVAIVVVTITMKGKYHEQLIDGKFRYIRVWKLFNMSWKIIAGSSIQL